MTNNMKGKMIKCTACGTYHPWEQMTRTNIKSMTPTKYYCPTCSNKDILVYQPTYKKHRAYERKKPKITYKEYLKKYCKCKGKICQ